MMNCDEVFARRHASRRKSNIIVIDNYDSFTYNLVQILESLGATCHVRLHDRITIQEIRELNPHGILLSPGGGTPHDTGVTLDVIHHLQNRIPILGICLGLQCIAMCHSARVVRAAVPVHGKASWIQHERIGLFRDLPSPFLAARYHSFLIEPESLSTSFDVHATTPSGEVMAISHRKMPLDGIQFHPESILTPLGAKVLKNWLQH